MFAMLISIAAAETSHANDKVADLEWYRTAAAVAFKRQTVPPVQIISSSVTGSTFRSELIVQPWVSDARLGFVLAAPAGTVTTASLSVHELAESTRTAEQKLEFQREVVVPVKSLGYVRGNHLVKADVPGLVAGTFGRRLHSGTLNIHYTAPLDPAAPRLDSPETPRGDGADPFNKMLDKLVANGADLKRFQVPLAVVPGRADVIPGPPLGGNPGALASFTVSEEGFVQFRGADLADCGVDLANTDVTSVSVWSEGEKQALVLLDDLGRDGRTLKPTDVFCLYARTTESTYTAERTYWIRISDEQPLWADFIISAPTSGEVKLPQIFKSVKTVENDTKPVLTKNDQFLTILGYRWVWWTWTPSGEAANLPSPRDYNTSGVVEFALPGLFDDPQPAELTLDFYAHQWPAKVEAVSFEVGINGSVLGTVAVDETDGMTHKLHVPAGLLRETTNTVTLQPRIPQAANLPEIAFDRLQVRYARSYKLTSTSLEFNPPTASGGVVGLDLSTAPTTNVLLADITDQVPKIIAEKAGAINGIRYLHTDGPIDRRYIAVDPDSIPRMSLKKYEPARDLRSRDNRADMIVIAWHDFIADLEPWVEQKRGLGHAVEVVDVQDIYDQFGFGQLSPHAIRAFLRYVAEHWQGSSHAPAGSYVLLVGDSTSAYRNEFRNDVINYVPTMRITNTDNPFASDQWYVSSFGNDAFADAMIGRFSVNNREDLRTIIDKQLEYAAHSTTAPWQNMLGFIADHTEFDETLERVMTRAVPPRFEMNKVSMSNLPWIDNYYFPKDVADARRAKVSPEATVRIRDMFNNGAAVVTYFGHGSPNIWSNERMWFGGDSPNSDNLLLTNRDRLPIVINMTCNSGAIDYPQPNWNIAISEDFMRVENGGAVACFVPSGPGLTIQHERLMMEIGHELFAPEQQPLGHSLQLALWRYLADNNPLELGEMFILLGDPLLVPKISLPHATDAPTSAPVGKIRNLQMVNWSRVDQPSATTDKAVLELLLENRTAFPTRHVALEISDPAGRILARSAAIDMLPFATERVTVKVPIQAGINSFRGWIVDEHDRVEMQPAVPFAAVGLRGDHQRVSIAPAVIDTRTVEVRYRVEGPEINATVSAQVYALAQEPLSNLRMGLQGKDGLVDQGSIITVPATAPGLAARVSLSKIVPDGNASENFFIRFDPAGFYPEFARFPTQPVNIGFSQFPDIVINSVTPSTDSPTEGETVFFDVEIRNNGESSADAVRPVGYTVLENGQRKRLFSQVLKDVLPINLMPGSSETVRLRWDPFQNVGLNTLVFSAESIYGTPDKNTADNETTLSLRARTKAALKNVKVHALPLTTEDQSLRQIRIAAQIRNDGETEAHGLRVAFYATPQKSDDDLLGHRDVEVVEPGKTVEVMLIYKLKPGEESRRFQFTSEVMYRGSRQRIPLER